MDAGLQSDIHYEGQIFLNSTILVPVDGRDVLDSLVLNGPLCRNMSFAQLAEYNVFNCSYRMYSLGGSFKIVQNGTYILCLNSSEGYYAVIYSQRSIADV